jgi:hypothetical protein
MPERGGTVSEQATCHENFTIEASLAMLKSITESDVRSCVVDPYCTLKVDNISIINDSACKVQVERHKVVSWHMSQRWISVGYYEIDPSICPSFGQHISPERESEKIAVVGKVSEK